MLQNSRVVPPGTHPVQVICASAHVCEQQVEGFTMVSQGQNLALTVLCVPYSLDSGVREERRDPGD